MKKWLKLISVILTFAIISIAIYLILKHFGVADVNNLKSILNKSGKFKPIIYTIILAVVLIIFCFIPLLNPTLTVLGIALFGNKVAFITNMIAVTISTTALFFIGDKLGEKFASKLVGKKKLEETQEIIDHKSKFWLPILFIAPCIPDEAICLVSGMTKMKYWYVLLVSSLYHAFEIGLFCFIGSGIISWSTLTFFDWLILTNIIAVDIYFLCKFEKYLNKKIKEK